AAGIVAAGAITAPVHRPVAGETTQRLCGHRPLHWMKVARCRSKLVAPEGVRVGDRRPVGIPQIPGEAVQIAEDVAAGAGGLAVAGGTPGVVEEGTPVD